MDYSADSDAFGTSYSDIFGESIRDIALTSGPWVREHAYQTALIVLLLSYSIRRNKLTIDGIIAALITGFIHMLHPSNAPFTLLLTFFLAGTIATRVKHDKKASLTKSYTGSSKESGKGGEGPRDGIQVLANSFTASMLLLADLYFCGDGHEKLRLIGIITVYAAAAADTLSSELGILASGQPFLITNPAQRVPRGTNGGVTLAGFGFALLGGAIIATAAYTTISWFDIQHVALITLSGLVGSVIDSILGALLQATVVDSTTGLVVEGANGRAIPIAHLDQNNANPFRISSLTILVGMLAVCIGKAYTQGPFADPFLEYLTSVVLTPLGSITCLVIVSLVTSSSADMTKHNEPTKEAGVNRDGHKKDIPVPGRDGSMASWTRRGVDAASNNDINFYMILITTGLAMLIYRE